MSDQTRSCLIGLGLALAICSVALPVYGQTLAPSGNETASIGTAGSPLVSVGGVDRPAPFAARSAPGFEHGIACQSCSIFQTNEVDHHHLTTPRWGTAGLNNLGGASSQGVSGQSSARSWPARHPILLGTLIGTGVGVGIAMGTFPEPHNPDVTKGGYATQMGLLGAGLGALVGWGFSLTLR